MTEKTNPAASFIAALGAAGSPFPEATTDVPRVRRVSQAALQSVTRLREYRAYLEQARAYKASGGMQARAIDRQVLARGRDALGDIRTLAVSILDIVRSMRDGGTLGPLARSWRQALAKSGPVAAADVWAHVTSSESARDAIRTAGVDDALLAALGEGVQSTDARMSVRGDYIVVVGTFNGGPSEASLATAPRPARPASVAELLARSRYDAVADALKRGEPAYLDGVPYLETDVRIEDVVLYGALAACADGVRHVRKLEDVGLETYRGGGPAAATILLYIALGAVGLGSILSLDGCRTTDGHVHNPDECSWGKGLASLGGIILLGLLGSGVHPPTSTSSSNLSLGSALIHGVVKDFERSRS